MVFERRESCSSPSPSPAAMHIDAGQKLVSKLTASWGVDKFVHIVRSFLYLGVEYVVHIVRYLGASSISCTSSALMTRWQLLISTWYPQTSEKDRMFLALGMNGSASKCGQRGFAIIFSKYSI